MNESEFETELRRLTPAHPSAELADRIAAELDGGSPQQSARTQVLHALPSRGELTVKRSQLLPVLMGLCRRLLWATAGAAAAFAYLSSRTEIPGALQPAPAASVTATSLPAAVPPMVESSELIAATDEGLFIDEENAEPQRQMRLTYLERHVWTNPELGAVIEFEVPREDVVLMPVAMQ